MLNYATNSQLDLNATEAVDVMADLVDDLRGVAMTMVDMASSPGIEPEQVGMLADVLTLATDAARAVLAYLKDAAATKTEEVI
jgi:hypothetical protein